MGNECSRDQWRIPHSKLAWTPQFKTTLSNEINRIPIHGTTKPCILLAAPVSAGKSSLVNTFFSAELNRLIRKADSGADTRSVTTDFKEDSPISEEDEHYIKDPSDLEKSHCLAIVIPCTQVENISPAYKDKIVKAIRAARRENIPGVIVLTMIDRLCTHVMESVDKVFTCSHIRDVVRMAKETFGVPEMYIFPLMNYSSQLIKDDCTNIIALLTLKKILEFTSDHIEGPEQQ